LFSHTYKCPNKCQDEEAPDSRTNKGKAPLKRSACPTNTGNERCKVHRVSAREGLTMVAGSMENAFGLLKDMVSDSFQCAQCSGAMEAEARALEAIEMEEGISNKDIRDAALIIENNPSFANLYLHMKSEGTCKDFLHYHIEKLKNCD